MVLCLDILGIDGQVPAALNLKQDQGMTILQQKKLADFPSSFSVHALNRRYRIMRN